MTLEIGVILAAIVVLLVLSAFFNLSETALTASSRARMHALEQEENSKARLVFLQRKESLKLKLHLNLEHVSLQRKKAVRIKKMVELV